MAVAKHLSFPLDLFEELRCLSEDEQNVVRNCVVEATIEVLHSSILYSSLHGRVLLCEEDVELGVLQYVRALEHKKWWCTKGGWRQLNLLTEKDCTFGANDAPPVEAAHQAAAEDGTNEEDADVDDEEEQNDLEEGGGEDDEPVEGGEQQINGEDTGILQAEIETPPHAVHEEVGLEDGEQLVIATTAEAGDPEAAANTLIVMVPADAPVPLLASVPDPVAGATLLVSAPADPAGPLLTEPMVVDGAEEIANAAQQVTQAAQQDMQEAQQDMQEAQELQTPELAAQAAQQALHAEITTEGPANAHGAVASTAAAGEDSSSEWSAGEGCDSVSGSGSDTDSDFSGNTEGTYDSDCGEMMNDDGDDESENTDHSNPEASCAGNIMNAGNESMEAATAASAAAVSQQAAAGEQLVQHQPSLMSNTAAPGNLTSSLSEGGNSSVSQAPAATQPVPAVEAAHAADTAAESASAVADTPPAHTSTPEPPALPALPTNWSSPTAASSAGAQASVSVSVTGPGIPAAAPAGDLDPTAGSWLEIAEQIRALDTPPAWIPILSSADVAAVLWDELLLQCDWHTWFFWDMIEQVRTQMPGAAHGAGVESQFGFDRMLTIDSVVVLMPLLNFVFWNAILAVRGDARSVFALSLWGARWAFVDLLCELKQGLPEVPTTVSSNTASSSSACGSKDARCEGNLGRKSCESDGVQVASVHSGGGDEGRAVGDAEKGNAGVPEGDSAGWAGAACIARNVRLHNHDCDAGLATLESPPSQRGSTEASEEEEEARAAGDALLPPVLLKGGREPSVGGGGKKSAARTATALLPMMAVFSEPFLSAAIATYLM